MLDDYEYDEYADEDGFYIITRQNEDEAQLFHLGNLLLLIALCLLMFFILSFCWSYCGEESGEKPDSDEGRRVIAREVRPGLIIVHNSKSAEDTLRIIQEYDAMQGQISPNSFPQCGGVPEAANTRATFLQSASPTYYSNTRATSFETESLIDMDMEELYRPPPYAPRATYK